jgi:hypothetical protein
MGLHHRYKNVTTTDERREVKEMETKQRTTRRTNISKLARQYLRPAFTSHQYLQREVISTRYYTRQKM